MKLSVIIPTYNRADTIGITIDSLIANQLPPSEYEIVVVDNRSTDGTAAIVREAQARSSVPIRYLYEERAGVHYARNRGALEARGELLYFTDDDMVATPAMLEQLMRVFEIDPRIASVSGRVLPRWQVDPPAWVLEHCQNTLLSLHLRTEDLIVADYDMSFSCHQMVRKAALLECGGFNPENTGGTWVGDGETGLGIKFKARGYRFGFVGGSVIYHMIPATRMTQSYLHRRMTNQGAADVYSWYRERRPTDAQLSRSQLGSMKRAAVDLVRSWGSRLMGRSAWRIERARVSYHRAYGEFCRRIRRDAELQAFVLRDDWIDR